MHMGTGVHLLKFSSTKLINVKNFIALFLCDETLAPQKINLIIFITDPSYNTKKIDIWLLTNFWSVNYQLSILRHYICVLSLSVNDRHFT